MRKDGTETVVNAATAVYGAIGSSIKTTLTSTGLAVTGALSATSTLSTSDTTDATSTTAASLVTAGGLAVAKKAYFGNKVNGVYTTVLSFAVSANTSKTVTVSFSESTYQFTNIGIGIFDDGGASTGTGGLVCYISGHSNSVVNMTVYETVRATTGTVTIGAVNPAAETVSFSVTATGGSGLRCNLVVSSTSLFTLAAS